MMTEPISVTALNQYVKGLLDRDRLLSQVLVRSEMSNYKVYPSGHHYFSLKDAESSIRCVMFRREAASLRFRPENGMKVVVSGRVSVFPRDGVYQLYCNHMMPDGMGELAYAFEQLKNRLHKEGLFDPARKKPLPAYPHTIALITSPAGAAVRDMIRILGARWPMAKVLVVPVRVQGEGAAQEIAQALDLVNTGQMADLILTGRGGGSMEDLWAFNEEVVARAIARSAIPVIAAVGHEPDVTIADFAADLRASTPSNGAERAVPTKGNSGTCWHTGKPASSGPWTAPSKRGGTGWNGPRPAPSSSRPCAPFRRSECCWTISSSGWSMGWSVTSKRAGNKRPAWPLPWRPSARSGC